MAKIYNAPQPTPSFIVTIQYCRDCRLFHTRIDGHRIHDSKSYDEGNTVAHAALDRIRDEGYSPRELAREFDDEQQWRYEMARAELSMQLMDAQQASGVAYMKGLLLVDAASEVEQMEAA